MVTRLFYFHKFNMSQRYCPNCNFTTTDSSTTYCPRCGKPLVEQSAQTSAANSRYCPHCGRPNPINATFCSSCGKPLNPQSQPMQPPQSSMASCPPTYLVWSILTTVLCCLPAGVVSIVYANKVEKLWHMGQYQESREASEKAKTWAIVSAVASVVVGFLWFIIVLAAS